MRGPVGPRLRTAIEGFEVVASGADASRLVGWVADQSALQAALKRVADFGLELVAVQELTDR